MAEFGKLNFAVAFNPQTAFPLDARYYFSSKTDADAAAATAVEVGSSTGTYFFGQNLVVVADNKATLYVIQPDKTLKAVGSSPVGDNKTIVVGTDGKISLKVPETIEAGMTPSLNANGELIWAKPDTTTVEGMAASISAVEGRTSTLETTVGNSESGLVKTVADLNSNLTTNYYNKTEVDGKLAGAFHFKGEKASLEELNAVTGMVNGDVYQVAQKEYAYNGEEWVELGFGVDLSAYATSDSVATLVQQTEAAAKSYADTKAAAAETNAKTYADEQIAALNISNYATTASVTSSIAAAKTELQSYTDTAEQDAITAANDAIAAKIGEVGEGTVKAYVDTQVTALRTTTDSLTERLTAAENEIDNIPLDGQANTIETIQLNGIALVPDENKAVNIAIPAATAAALGLVKSSSAENNIAVATDGTMTVNSLNVNKLTQTEGDTLTFECGSAN